MCHREHSGVWAAFLPGIGHGARYKYQIASRYHGYQVEKADPFAFFSEVPPHTASVVWDRAYAWGDQAWMAQRRHRNALDAPMAIYELHLGSCRRAEDNRPQLLRTVAPGIGAAATAGDEVARAWTAHFTALGEKLGVRVEPTEKDVVSFGG